MAKNHALLLGKLVGNLQSLEALLRVFLVKRGSKRRGVALPHPSFGKLAVGDYVPEDEFTNFDSLGDLIKKYNADVSSLDPSLQVDASVVPLRDLLAHGRIGADVPDEARLTIIKFDKPVGGKVRVMAAALMDDAWFEANTALVRDQLLTVHRALESHAA